MSRTRTAAPLTLAERHAPLGPGSWLRIASEQDVAGHTCIAVYVMQAHARDADAGPVLRLGAVAAGELARGLTALAAGRR